MEKTIKKYCSYKKTYGEPREALPNLLYHLVMVPGPLTATFVFNDASYMYCQKITLINFWGVNGKARQGQ